ncbi:MAG: PucC family protein [Myxococcota bacterium]
MSRWSEAVLRKWVSLGPRFLPFADVATPDLPLSRLLRLSLFQVSVGMTMVLLVGTLNRVMIVELGVPTSLVAVMIALPLVFAPFRALIGFSSDHHRSALGWRRVPFLWKGTMWQFCGYAFMPFAILVLAGKGESHQYPAWMGQIAAAAAFLAVGAGMHTVQTAGLALATDLTPKESHPKVVGLMYVTLLLGMMGSALLFGVALENYIHAKLVGVIQGTALATLFLNVVAMWKQETRRPGRFQPEREEEPSFREAWAHFCQGDHAIRRLVIVGIGTLAFGLSEVILEPFGGQVLELEVSSTTKLTALLAFGGLCGFGYASRILRRGSDVQRVTQLGLLLGVPGFVLVLSTPVTGILPLFLVGNFLVGFGGAIFGHATLTDTMNRAPKDQVGLALGAWGAVQATAAGSAMALSGILRDVFDGVLGGGTAAGYNAVYVIELVLLVVTIVVVAPLVRSTAPRPDLYGGGAPQGGRA